jgi:hypothetical protein
MARGRFVYRGLADGIEMEVGRDELGARLGTYAREFGRLGGSASCQYKQGFQGFSDFAKDCSVMVVGLPDGGGELLGDGHMKPDRIPLSGIEFLHFCEEAGYESLPIRERHVIALESLPPIHADPFDRILVAQTGAESMVLLTHDGALAEYGEDVRVV